MNFINRLRLPRLIAQLVLPLLLLGSTAFADVPVGFDERIDQIMEPIANGADAIIFTSIKVAGQALPLVLIALAGTALFLTIYFRFINFRAFGLALRTTRGDYTPDNAPGQITHFQALTAALSATVGLGNIGGVAVAIGLGGPGATFWMIVMGLCGMTTKFCECTLGVRYRTIDENGNVHGGAMYYLSRGLAERNMAMFGKILAVFFAVMTIGGAIGAGCMYQVNQAHAQFSGTFGIMQDQGWLFGLILALAVGFVIIGGIVAIARVTSFLVPFMCGIFVLASLVVIGANIGEVGSAFGQIFSGAFSNQAMFGGLVGVLIQGIKRAAFSNEAGLGSAPIAHSAVKTDKPASEGLVALLEPFVDTVVVCTMTALVIIIGGTWKVGAEVQSIPENQPGLVMKTAAGGEIDGAMLEKGALLRILGDETVKTGAGDDETATKWLNVRVLDEEEITDTEIVGWVKEDSVAGMRGVPVTSMAFERVISWFPYVLSIAVLLFAFSTMISWSYYGEQGVVYLFGKKSGGAVLVYKLFFCLCVVIGSAASLGNVLKLSDAMIFAMVAPNLIGIYVLLPRVKEELAIFMKCVRETENDR
ncbi:MAG: AGCS family alanine or glycine:cation symporter [Pseudoalteromonas tetraodonis]|jgi:AGCS family alanine or glycine:cation symporter